MRRKIVSIGSVVIFFRYENFDARLLKYSALESMLNISGAHIDACMSDGCWGIFPLE
jgi:hypothetical protein